MAARQSARLATLTDAAAITAIYNEGIEDRIATFETEPRTLAQITAQLAERGDAHPTLVVERDGAIVAWAGAGPYASRPVYAGIAEHSVYVARPHAAAAPVGLPWTRFAAPTRSATSGSSPHASSRRTRPASRCMSGPASASSAPITATASWRAPGAATQKA